MKSALKLAPEPKPENLSATVRRGGLKTDRVGGVVLKRCMIFQTTGQYRIIKNGKPGPWLRGPAETP